VAGEEADDATRADLNSSAVRKHKSNAILLADETGLGRRRYWARSTVWIRADSVLAAIVAGSVAASDASLLLRWPADLPDAGCKKAVVQPGGSIRDAGCVTRRAKAAGVKLHVPHRGASPTAPAAIE
jgi:AICAR transformylase/IMP cyclohydrolase PurH